MPVRWARSRVTAACQHGAAPGRLCVAGAAPLLLRCRASVVESRDLLAFAEHEGVGHMAQRRYIDVRAAAGDQFGEALIQRRVLGFLLQRLLGAGDPQARAAVAEFDLALRRGDDDVPALLAGLAPVEFGVDGQRL